MDMYGKSRKNKIKKYMHSKKYLMLFNTPPMHNELIAKFKFSNKSTILISSNSTKHLKHKITKMYI
jgi:hypothetical protein